jgi:hypothetical protein
VNAIDNQRVRPGKTGYWIALLIFLLGCGGSGYLLYDGISSLADGLVRAEVPTVPANPLVTFDKAGTWTVFHESPSVLDGQTYNAPLPDGTSVFLLGGPGDEIPMTPAVGSLTYDLAGRSGVAIGRLNVDNPGDYTLVVEYPPGAPSDPTVLAFGHEKGKATIKTVGGIAGILASGFIAMIIFLIVLIMRSRSKNRLREAGVQA